MTKRDLREGYILTEQECVEKGGHKYEAGLTYMGNPFHRYCKYCGHGQKGYNPPTVWEDITQR